jgi:hypothetical protein
LTQVSGTLTAIAIAGGQDYHYFKVTIDGNLVVDEALCGGGTWMHNSIGLNLPFSRNLKVEIADSIPSTMPIFWVSYFVGGCNMIKRGKPARKEVDGINFAYRTDFFQTEDGKEYGVEYSSGAWSLSEVAVNVDAYRAGKIELSGSISVLEQSEDNPDEFVNADVSNVVLVCRPAGKSAEFAQLPLGGWVEGQREFNWTIEYLPPGDFEIVATIPKFVNKPALIRVLWYYE